ncbi:hypothetical protein GOP47_0026816 [Adiantum capillus-veneris]|nr:hypothetical protein GOP47_0026816 [Adiantum capillus-veneris]
MVAEGSLAGKIGEMAGACEHGLSRRALHELADASVDEGLGSGVVGVAEEGETYLPNVGSQPAVGDLVHHPGPAQDGHTGADGLQDGVPTAV